MIYFYHMPRVLRLDASVYRDIYSRNAALWYCVINVLGLGLIYGLVSVYFSSHVLDQMAQQGAVSVSRLVILLVGLSVAFLMHGGAALFIWVFCKALGGCRQFMPPYLNLGISAIALWPVAPALSALQSGYRDPALLIYLAVVLPYAAAVMYVAIREVSQLSTVKMIAAAVLTVVYIGCFLYLWL